MIQAYRFILYLLPTRLSTEFVDNFLMSRPSGVFDRSVTLPLSVTL